MLVKKFSLIGVGILTLLLLSFGLGVVNASSNSKDKIINSVDNTTKKLNERIVEIKQNDNKFVIISERKAETGQNKDRLTMEVKYDADGIAIKVDYFAKVATQNTQTTKNNKKSEINTQAETVYNLEFKVVFKQLIEFVDLDGNGIYDPSKDQTVKIMDLSAFGPANYSRGKTADGSILHKLTIATVNDTFVVHIYIVEQHSKVDGRILPPTEMKIDLKINNFTYTVSNSQLALYVKLESKRGYKDEKKTEDVRKRYTNDEEGINTEESGYNGTFSWSKTADIDGVSKDMLTSDRSPDDSDKNQEKMYFCFPRGTFIYYDPKIGVEGITQESSSLTLFIGIILVVSILSVATVVIGLTIRKLRKRER